MEEIEVKLVRLCPNCGTVTDYDTDLKCKTCGQYTKEEVIAGELAVGPAAAIAEREGRFERKRMCRECGKEIDMNARVCQYCDIKIPDSRVSANTIMALAVIPGIFGLHGLGHIILGRIAVGFLILFAGLALIGGLIACAITYYYYLEPTYIALVAILAIAYIVLFVWQVMDANASIGKYTRAYESHKVE
ncbi:MAG: zinc ribbon domain-containing protein [Chloroflexi bacterium]|nr:zinc ribbon domain-containing protein [Chloroflexota bacterium]